MQQKNDHTLAELVVFAFIFSGEHVLLIERALEPFKGQRTIPGGHKKPGETLRASCLREIKEETGLDLKKMTYAGILHTLPEKTGGQEYVSHYFVCRCFSGDLIASKEGKLFWIPINDLLSFSGQGGIHPAFSALFPFILTGKYPFEAHVCMDRKGKGEYQVFPVGS